MVNNVKLLKMHVKKKWKKKKYVMKKSKNENRSKNSNFKKNSKNFFFQITKQLIFFCQNLMDFFAQLSFFLSVIM